MKKEVLEFHADFCKAFSNPKRLAILCLLKSGELTASDIIEKLGVSKVNASQHLALMRRMRILKTRREGTNIYYMLANKKLAQACGLIQDGLGQLMEGSIGLEKEAIAAMEGDEYSDEDN
jgi:DNA-binding transcriptional ArsR family regulator